MLSQVKMSPHKPGDVCLVLGGGPIGLAVIQCLRAQGAQTIIVSEIAETRKQYAASFGATHVVDPTKEDLITRCRELTKGRGVHVCFDAAGIQSALTQAIECLRVHGTLVNIAIWEKPAAINPTRLVLKERSYQATVTYRRGDYEEVLMAIALGNIKPEKMITKKVKVRVLLSRDVKLWLTFYNL